MDSLFNRNMVVKKLFLPFSSFFSPSQNKEMCWFSWAQGGRIQLHFKANEGWAVLQSDKVNTLLGMQNEQG